MTTMNRLSENSPELPLVLELIRSSFAYMDDRIDPPSSMHELRESDVRTHCTSEEVWVIGAPPLACMFLTRKEESLYVGKVAVGISQRGRGLAKRLIETAEQRARQLGKSFLELNTRIELTENHATFEKLGFTRSGEHSHEGFDRPTYISMRKAVSR